MQYLVYALGAVAILVVAAIIQAQFRRRRELERGWRVGHVGRDAMYYDELHDGTWRRIEVDGGMLMGKAHHVIYFSGTEFPDWARERRDEIISRIKSEFRAPGYEYED